MFFFWLLFFAKPSKAWGWVWEIRWWFSAHRFPRIIDAYVLTCFAMFYIMCGDRRYTFRHVDIVGTCVGVFGVTWGAPIVIKGHLWKDFKWFPRLRLRVRFLLAFYRITLVSQNCSSLKYLVFGFLAQLPIACRSGLPGYLSLGTYPSRQ